MTSTRTNNIAIVGLITLSAFGFIRLRNYVNKDEETGFSSEPIESTPIVSTKALFGAPRNNSSGRHNGLDLVAYKGEQIYSPIEGVMVRYSSPYADDLRWTGVLIRGTGPHQGYEIKIWYMNPSVTPNQTILQGMPIGTAQAISEKWGANMLDHIHIGVWRNGKLIDPQPLLFG